MNVPSSQEGSEERERLEDLDLMLVLERIITASEKRLVNEGFLERFTPGRYDPFTSMSPDLFEDREVVKLLIVEDDETITHDLESLLRQVGCIDFQVLGVATSGPEGVRLAYEVSPDLVIIDLTLPGLNGVSVTERLATLPSNPPIIALTGVFDELVTHAFHSAGAMAVFPKDDLPRLVRYLKAIACKPGFLGRG